MKQENLKILQEELLRVFKVFANACDKANLKYYLFFGTLIGAVRHNGFIPWDDDIDVAMPRPDYEKFIALYKDYLDDSCFLDGYRCDYYQSNSPLLRVNSRRVFLRRDQNGQEKYIPVFVGIFPIDGLPSNSIRRICHIKHIMFRYGLLRASRASLYGVGTINNRTLKDNVLVLLNNFLKIGRVLKPRSAAKGVDLCMAKYALDKSKFCHVMDYDKCKSDYYTDDFADCLLVKFEDTFARIPKGYDRILRDYYGDYMKLPPIEKQVPRHGIQIRFADVNQEND